MTTDRTVLAGPALAVLPPGRRTPSLGPPAGGRRGRRAPAGAGEVLDGDGTVGTVAEVSTAVDFPSDQAPDTAVPTGAVSGDGAGSAEAVHAHPGPGSETAPAGRIWYVIRLAEDDTDHEHPHMAFPDPEAAERHRAAAQEATGVAHVVRDLPFAVAAPPLTLWHCLSTDIALNGTQMWTTQVERPSFAGADDAVVAATARWRIILRETPSQPQSRVRLEIVGPSRAWCAAAARACWQAASTSPEFQVACDVEAMFLANRRRG